MGRDGVANIVQKYRSAGSTRAGSALTRGCRAALRMAAPTTLFRSPATRSTKCSSSAGARRIACLSESSGKITRSRCPTPARPVRAGLGHTGQRASREAHAERRQTDRCRGRLAQDGQPARSGSAPDRTSTPIAGTLRDVRAPQGRPAHHTWLGTRLVQPAAISGSRAAQDLRPQAWFKFSDLVGDKSWVAGVELATASEPPARRAPSWGRRPEGVAPRHPNEVYSPYEPCENPTCGSGYAD